MVAHFYNLNTGKVGARGSEVQDYPQNRGQFVPHETLKKRGGMSDYVLEVSFLKFLLANINIQNDGFHYDIFIIGIWYF